jgi:hypothetical protein
MANGGGKKKREIVRPEEETAGYRRRRQELEEIEDTEGSLNVSAASQRQQAERGLERQEHIIRLRRKRRP